MALGELARPGSWRGRLAGSITRQRHMEAIPYLLHPCPSEDYVSGVER